MTINNFPTTRPAFTANFARSQQLPPQVTFSRASQATSPAVPSPGTATGPNGSFLSDYDTPRFAWKDGKCQGLLLEVGRTNTWPLSGDPESTFNSQVNATVVNGVTAPDGSNNAATMTITAGAGSARTTTNNVAIAGSIWAGSIFVKAGTVSSGYFNYNGRANTNFDLTANNGQGSADGNGTITPIGNGWYRVSTTYDATSDINRGLKIGFSGSANDTMFIWGLQNEESSYVTSYIPTSGSQATRAPDIFDINGDDFTSWYNKPESTMVVNMSCKRSTGYGLMWGYYGGGKRIEGYPGLQTPFSGLCFFYDNVTQKYIGRGDGTAVWNQDGLLQKCAYTWNFQTGEGAAKLQDAGFAPANPPTTGVPLTEPTAGFRLMGGQNATKVTNAGIVASVHYYPHEVSLEALEALTQ